MKYRRTCYQHCRFLKALVNIINTYFLNLLFRSWRVGELLCLINQFSLGFLQFPSISKMTETQSNINHRLLPFGLLYPNIHYSMKLKARQTSHALIERVENQLQAWRSSTFRKHSSWITKVTEQRLQINKFLRLCNCVWSKLLQSQAIRDPQHRVRYNITISETNGCRYLACFILGTPSSRNWSIVSSYSVIFWNGREQNHGSWST